MSRIEMHALIAEAELKGSYWASGIEEARIHARLEKAKPNSKTRARCRLVIKRIQSLPTWVHLSKEIEELNNQIAKGLMVPREYLLLPPHELTWYR
jgi:hypothetical protein